MHDFPLTRRFGPELRPGGRVRFALWAPSVEEVSLELDGQRYPMQRLTDGWFEAEQSAGPGARYQFVLPDGLRVPDPASRAQSGDVHGPSLIVEPNDYVWKNVGWCNRPWHEAVIYEVHPGLFGGFEGVQAQLPFLRDLGITAIELMPVADFPGRRNWGYDGVLPYAPDETYGTPAQLKALVDAAHGLGLMVLLDVVYNHFGPDGAYMHVYAKPFFDPEIHTPWGAAIDFTRPEVQRFFIDNALMWLREYRFDGLRFDAVHAIAPQDFLPILAAELRAGAGRDVHLVLEHEGNRASLLRPSPDQAGFDAQWSDDFHHCLHVLLTGEFEGYYAGFQNPAEQLARALAEGFVDQGERGRGEPSAHLPSTAFVICLQNHDQVGNRAMGERLSSLADPGALRAAIALMLLSPFIPLLFMGEETGTERPFLFFTDHNAELAPLVREGRRREFRHFAAFQDEARRERIPDPNDPATFTACSIAGEAATPDGRAMVEYYRTLLGLRARVIVPGIEGCRSLGATPIGPRAVQAAWRLGDGRRLTLAGNFDPAPVSFEAPTAPIFCTATLASGRLPGYCTAAFVDEAS